MAIKTPVVLVMYNRPEHTKRVLERLRTVQPSLLLVVADGPKDNLEDVRKCNETRALIEKIDWNCEVRKNYSAINLGCKYRPASGFDWVFQLVDDAIILEDDCIPHPSFFGYCEQLLDYYRNDSRIFMISGDNYQFGRKRTPYSYYFSRYPHVSGWATWRRTWKLYDLQMSLWPQIRQEKWLFDLLADIQISSVSNQWGKAIARSMQTIEYWYRIFDAVYAGKIDCWDYQLTFFCWIHNALNIIPNVNLVSNIGYGPEGTHTQSDSPLGNIPACAIEFPLNHPPFIIRDARADTITQMQNYG